MTSRANRAKKLWDVEKSSKKETVHNINQTTK